MTDQILDSHSDSLDYLLLEQKEKLNRIAAFVFKVGNKRNQSQRVQYDRIIGVLANWRVHADTLQSALIHPTLEFNEKLPNEITQILDPDAIIGAKKIAPFMRKGPDDARQGTEAQSRVLRMERLRGLFALAYDNFELVLICLADHYSRKDDLEVVNRVERRLWAEETDDIFLPLCEMFGMWQLRQELGGLILSHVLDEKTLDLLNKHILQYRNRYEEPSSGSAVSTFETIKSALEREFAANNLQALCRPHVIHPGSLYRRNKYERWKGQRFEWKDFFEFLRVDIIAANELECYKALGIIHKLGYPVSGQSSFGKRFNDYIGTPRFNGYQSLLTTVRFGDRTKKQLETFVEFRIQTKEMNMVNQYGIVAAKLSSSIFPSIKNAWWENKEVREALGGSLPESISNHIYVFSPIGEVYWLPKDSSPVDYAFRVHTSLGPYAKTFWVNGLKVGFDYTLKDGDLLLVEYDQTFPSLDLTWAEVVRTPGLKKRIERLLIQLDSKSEGEAKIRKIIRREQDICRLWFTEDAIKISLNRTANRLGCSSLTELYVQVADGTRSADEVVSRVIEDQLVDYIVQDDDRPWPREHVRIAQCWMTTKKDLRNKRESRVIPGDEIVGRIVNPGSAIPELVIHLKGCSNLRSSSTIIPLKWRASRLPREVAFFSVSAWDRPRVLDELLHPVYDLYKDNLYLQGVVAEVNNDNSATIELTVDSQSLVQINELTKIFETMKQENQIKEFSVYQPLPGQKVLLGGRANLKSQNPYTLGEIRTRAMFFGREKEIGHIASLIQRGVNPIVLYGHKRVGKTSLLYQLMDNDFIRECQVIPVLFNLESLPAFDTSFFFQKLSEQIDKSVKELFDIKGYSGVPRLRPRDFEKNYYWVFGQWLDKIHEQLHGRKLLILIDEFGRVEKEYREGKVPISFFEGLRWMINAYPKTTFIFCTQESIYHSPQSQRVGSWLLLQRGEPVRLGYLDQESAIRLICQPVANITYDQSAIDRIIALTGSSPFFIQVVCREIVIAKILQPKSNVSIEDIDDLTKLILTSGEHYFSHFTSEANQLKNGIEVLTAIAIGMKENSTWVARSKIQWILKREGYGLNPGDLTKSLRILSSLDIIKSREGSIGWEYFIPVDLFRIWLRQTSSFSSILRG